MGWGVYSPAVIEAYRKRHQAVLVDDNRPVCGMDKSRLNNSTLLCTGKMQHHVEYDWEHKGYLWKPYECMTCHRIAYNLEDE